MQEIFALLFLRLLRNSPVAPENRGGSESPPLPAIFTPRGLPYFTSAMRSAASGVQLF
jgi:hypothetical protein